MPQAMSSNLRIGLVQCQIVDGEAIGNLERVLALLDAGPAADLLLLPELWTTGYAHGVWPDVADRETPIAVERLHRFGRERQVAIAGSMISRNAEGDLVNRFWLLLPGVPQPIYYDKGHLFAGMKEDEHLAAGSVRVRVPWRGWTVALSICFDLRFPEMYRLDAVAGADLFLVVAEWPEARKDALRIMARSRAVENQSFLALCNRVGTASDGTKFGGGSVVVAPDGSLLTDAGQGEGVFVAEIESCQASAARADLPVLGLRRSGLDTTEVG
jgi:omega-amidase